MSQPIIVTGGAGFIGSALVREALSINRNIVVIDKLTYAGNLASLAEVKNLPGFAFEQLDICDRSALDRVFKKYRPDGVIHLAAESHVDRSIDAPGEFIKTNIDGTYQLLEASRRYTDSGNCIAPNNFRFHHVSTDEVFGDLGGDSEEFFTEETPYNPSSPYSASKAASDHLVRAWGHTFKLPVVVTNCSNNYGPRQFPEKLIPHIILNALAGKPLPIYGDGKQIRDWLFVDDHAKALLTAYRKGQPGETYNIGGNNQKTNLEVVHTICDLLKELIVETDFIAPTTDFRSLITFVKDRPGHDLQYAIDPSKTERELGWKPSETFETGLRKTIKWYLDNQDWWEPILDRYSQTHRLGRSANRPPRKQAKRIPVET